MTSTSRLTILAPPEQAASLPTVRPLEQAVFLSLNAPNDRFEVIVQVSLGVTEQALASFATTQGGRIENRLAFEDPALTGASGGVYLLSFPDSPDREATVTALRGRPGVEMVEFDSRVSASLVSTDTQYGNGALWGMYGPSGDGIGAFSNSFGSHADVVWGRSDISADGKVGSMRTVVGLIDTGVDPLHPDLYLNIWINQKEIPAGLDNDGNGFVDDLFGWDFRDNDNRPFESFRGGTSGITEPADSQHGTHVAGTIGGSSTWWAPSALV